MLNSTELKNNICFIYQDEPFKVLQYKHTHMGRGGADIKIKAKNLKTLAILNLNFGANDRFEEVDLTKKKMQFLYQDENGFNFMDPKSFEQLEIEEKIIGLPGKFLQQGDEINVLFWEDKPLDIEMPLNTVVEIAQCDPGERGNSVSNLMKNASTKEGVKLRVPLFIKEGDKVKVDTRTGEYIERVSK